MPKYKCMPHIPKKRGAWSHVIIMRSCHIISSQHDFKYQHDFSIKQVKCEMMETRGARQDLGLVPHKDQVAPSLWSKGTNAASWGSESFFLLCNRAELCERAIILASRLLFLSFRSCFYHFIFILFTDENHVILWKHLISNEPDSSLL